MTQPKAYMLTAPDNNDDPFGNGMASADLIRRLKLLNSKVVIPMPEHFDAWYPGQKAGQTCIWIGPPSEDTSLKVCSFHLGHIPEYSQVGPKGKIICRGWRSILEKCIKAGVASKQRLESGFQVRLDYEGKTKLCDKCLRRGERVRATDPSSGLCDLHEEIRLAMRRVKHQKEMEGCRQ